MVALTIALLVALILVAIAFVLLPLRRTAAGSIREEEHFRLAREKEGLLQLLRELDFDRAVGKLSEEEHERQRAEVERMAIEVMKRLDAAGRLSGDDPAELLIRVERSRVDREAGR